MDIDKVSYGNPPDDLNAVIEIPLRGMPPVKYEIDKASGAMFVSRFLHTAMYYPVNYGFVPHTLADDGDPLDIMVVGRVPVMPGAVLRSRPIGVLHMEDEAGDDDKILCVPHDSLHPFWGDVNSWKDLPPILCDQIKHFFSHYKDLEEGKWVKVSDWSDRDTAKKIVMESIENFKREG
mgnify:CR=1 FL=1